MRNLSVLAAGSAFLAALGGATTAAAAHLPAEAGPGLPAAGTSVTSDEDGDMVIACTGVLHRFDLRGTGQTVAGDRITGPDGEPGVIMTTTSENLIGYDRDLGVVTVAEAAPAQGELVAARADRTFPAAASFAQDVTVSFEHSPCDDSGAPVSFRSKAPFPLLNTNLSGFPPKHDVYTLLDQVDLDSVDAPAPVTATLLQFPVTVSHSP